MAGIGPKQTTGNYQTREKLVDAIMLRHWRGFSQGEIAKVTGVSIRTVGRIIKAFNQHPSGTTLCDQTYDELVKAEQQKRSRARAIRDAVLIVTLIAVMAAAFFVAHDARERSTETVTVASE